LKRVVKIILMSAVFVFCTKGYAQLKDSLVEGESQKAWYIALPLRFTHLQNSHTLLSGIELGKRLSSRWSLSLAVYHSFYQEKWKPKARLAGFSEQPRLFINAVGVQLDYQILQHKNWAFWGHGFAGWGFLKYDLNAVGFRSSKRHFIALEPMTTLSCQFSNTTIGLGLGYRPLWGSKTIAYQSDIADGNIAIEKKLLNGINILLYIKGYFGK